MLPLRAAALAATSRVADAGGWLGVGLLVAGAVALYAPVFPSMARDWSEFPNLSHGFAIPVIAGVLVWARRAQLRALTPSTSPAGFTLLILGLTMLVVGIRSEEPFLARISLPVTLLGATLLVGGPALFKQLWQGIAYLVFMVPLPYSALKVVTYRSRIFDATASAHALGWLGVPVLQDGVWLHLPNITLEVADECSSIPALAALTALGAAYAMASRAGAVRGVVLTLASIPLAVTSNIVRITATAWATYTIGPGVLESTFHQFTGTTNFLLTFAFLLALDGTLLSLSRRHR